MKRKVKQAAFFYHLSTGILVSIVMYIAAHSCQAQQIREPAVAGQFYPADKKGLSTFVNGKLRQASAVSVKGEIMALVAPHAGYNFSGATAAAAYKQVAQQTYDLVVILAPSHRDPFHGATIYPGSAYKTPLGEAVIDVELAKKIAASSNEIALSVDGHRAEHSLEVQLPFIQTLFPRAKILPIVIGSYDFSTCTEVGKSVAKFVSKRKVLLVASTDLYHGESYDNCRQFSNHTLEVMQQLAPKKLYNELQSGVCQACGGGPVVVMQIAAKELGADRGLIISQTNSNDVIGRHGGYVVGYGAIVYYKSNVSPRQVYQPVPEKVQKEMLRMARSTIEHYLLHQQVPSFEPVFPELLEKRGLFVTITKDGMLRGCIGHHESDLPLYKLLPQMAVAAAFGDPRFPPLQSNELDHINIKISVYLTNVYQIADLTEFEMGVHGIIMRHGRHTATYLPEVPIEAGWTTVEQEMESLSKKAGLHRDAWKNDTEFWVYRTQVFDEKGLLK